MKTFVVFVVSVAVVVAAFVVFQNVGKDGFPDKTRDSSDDAAFAAGGGAPSKTPPVPGPRAALSAPYFAPPGGLEGEHLKAGAIGERVKSLMMATIGSDWRTMDRLKAAQAIHDIVSVYKPEDAEYLLKVFDGIQDPAFRWWFAALVRQIPDDRFADALVEVYRVDPIQASEALGIIGGPRSMSNLASLVDTQPDGDVRAVMFGAVARSKWEGKERYFAKIAEDERRGDVDRMHALATLGREGTDRASLDYLVATALGPARPVGELGNIASSFPERDLRAAAILGVMQRGDMDAARALIDSADGGAGDPTFVAMVDRHLAAYSGPDMTEILFARADRRKRVTLSELLLIQKGRVEGDLPRIRALEPYVVEDAKELFRAMLDDDR